MEYYSTDPTYAIGEGSVGASTILSETATENIGKYGCMPMIFDGNLTFSPYDEKDWRCSYGIQDFDR